MKFKAAVGVIILVFSFASCNGCITSAHWGKTPNVSDVRPPITFDSSTEAKYADQQMDHLLIDLLNRNTGWNESQKETAKIVRLGIIIGTLSYILERQSPEELDAIAHVAAEHLKNTRAYYQRQPLESHDEDVRSDPDTEEEIPDPSTEPSIKEAPVAPTARPMHDSRHEL